ncbi:MAG: hypothetical protein MSD82_02060 [Prevotella sp.]|nr:hypothetical protein [Prevotella sp.]
MEPVIGNSCPGEHGAGYEHHGGGQVKRLMLSALDSIRFFLKSDELRAQLASLSRQVIIIVGKDGTGGTVAPLPAANMQEDRLATDGKALYDLLIGEPIGTNRSFLTYNPPSP